MLSIFAMGIAEEFYILSNTLTLHTSCFFPVLFNVKVSFLIILLKYVFWQNIHVPETSNCVNTFARGVGYVSQLNCRLHTKTYRICST